MMSSNFTIQTLSNNDINILISNISGSIINSTIAKIFANGTLYPDSEYSINIRITGEILNVVSEEDLNKIGAIISSYKNSRIIITMEFYGEVNYDINKQLCALFKHIDNAELLEISGLIPNSGTLLEGMNVNVKHLNVLGKRCVLTDAICNLFTITSGAAICCKDNFFTNINTIIKSKTDFSKIQLWCYNEEDSDVYNTCNWVNNLCVKPYAFIQQYSKSTSKPHISPDGYTALYLPGCDYMPCFSETHFFRDDHIDSLKIVKVVKDDAKRSKLSRQSYFVDFHDGYYERRQLNLSN